MQEEEAEDARGMDAGTEIRLRPASVVRTEASDDKLMNTLARECSHMLVLPFRQPLRLRSW